MFDFKPSKLGDQIAEGMNSTIHYYDGRRSIVKRFLVFTEEKEKQFTDEFLLGINHKHQNILNYQGLSKRITNPIKKWSEICIKMKPMKKDLKRHIQERIPNGIPESEAIKIFYSLASALDYLEKKGIAHSNIIHESVLFNDVDTVKLAGFAFSKFKPWKNPQSRIYQSYFPPEKSGQKPTEQNVNEQMTDEERRKKMKESKELAFKSDVWCLGKLMVDVCLLRDQTDKGRNQKAQEILKKTQDDLAKVEAKYGESLTNILRSLLEEKPQARPSFANICSLLEPLYLNQILGAPFNNDDDDSPVSVDSFNSLPEEEETKTEGASQAQSASQNGSNSLLNQGMMVVESSFALSLSAFMNLRDSTSTRDTSQISDQYVPLLRQFYEANELHNEIVDSFLSEISTSISDSRSNTSAHPNFSTLLNALSERLSTLSSQTLEFTPGNSNANSDSMNLPNPNPLSLTSLLRKINAQSSKSQTSESNSAPVNPPDINQSESDQSNSLKKADEKA